MMPTTVVLADGCMKDSHTSVNTVSSAEEVTKTSGGTKAPATSQTTNWKDMLY